MNKVVAHIQGELLRRSSKIALFEEVEREVVVQKHPYSNVKFTPSKQQRFLYILLDDETAGL